MRQAIIFISFFVFNLLFLIYPKNIYAASDPEVMKVNPVILIPANYVSGWTQNRIDNASNEIIAALTEAQKFYLQQLDNRRTFTINTNIKVIRSSESYDMNDPSTYKFGKPPKVVEDMWYALDDGQYPDKEKTVYAYFIIGAKNLTQVGGIRKNYSGLLLMNESDIDNFLKPYGDKNRNTSVGILTHELGHAFGLEDSAFANPHVCSVISQDNCLQGPPYPPASEWVKGMMGVGAFIFPNESINSTLHNPEKCKLWQNPLINPVGGTCPFSQPNTAGSSTDLGYVAFNPNEAGQNDIFTIQGLGFGDVPGTLHFYTAFNYSFAKQKYIFDEEIDPQSFQVIEWTNSAITVKVLQVPEINSLWGLVVNRNDGKEFVNQEVQIRIKGSDLLGNSGYIKPIKVQTSCGSSNTPLPGVKIEKYTYIESNEQYNDNNFYETDGGGKLMIYIFSEGLVSTENVNITAKEVTIDGVEEKPQDPQAYAVDLSNQNLQTIHFLYPSCPRAPIPRSIKSVMVNNDLWDYAGSDFDLDLTKLGVTESQAKTVGVKATIEYTDGTSKDIFLNFNYQPEGVGGDNSCTDDEYEFRGCHSNVCGKEDWVCPKNGQTKVEDSPSDGDCRKHDVNPVCPATSNECSDDEWQFRGCRANTCGEEKWYCPKNGQTKTEDSPSDGDCRNPDINSYCPRDGGNNSCSDNDREFAGCANDCGRERWACPNNRDDVKEVDGPDDGDCRNPDINPACG